MDEARIELLKKSLHKFLVNGKGRLASYPWDFLVSVTATYCLEDREKEFLNFVEHIDLLPEISRLTQANDAKPWRRMSILKYLIVQCAAIILGNDTWFSSITELSSPPDSYEKFSDIILEGYSHLENSERSKMPIRSIGEDVKIAAENDNVANLKLLIDLARNQECKLRNIYLYLLRVGKYHLAEKLHAVCGRLDELVAPKALFDYWKEKIILDSDMTSKRFGSEWINPNEYPLHHLIIQGPFQLQAIKILRRRKLLEEDNLDVIWNSGISPDFILDADYPSLTYRKLMHFYFEFGDDLQTAIQHKKPEDDYSNLERNILEARQFIKWENGKCKRWKKG